MRTSFPSFGGVILWDASQAYGTLHFPRFAIFYDVIAAANNRHDQAIKNALSAAGGTDFTLPSCSAPVFAVGTNYASGSKVSFEG